MTAIQTENRTLLKAEIYKLLSLMYKEPKPDLSVHVLYLSKLMKHFGEPFSLICEDMNKQFEGGSQDLNEYIVEYARLFIGPFKLVAPPYSSVFLEDKWEVRGRSTQIVESFYQRAGLAVNPSNEPSDHISTQLEFMYYLHYKWNETNDVMYLGLQKEFLYKIFNHWIPKFNSAIQQGSVLSFYKQLGTITELFIQNDLEDKESQNKV